MNRLWPRPRKSDFPTVADATDEAAIPSVDAYDASRALAALWRLCEADLAKVYRAHLDHIHWQIWLEVTQRRVELRAWVREWLASQEQNGGVA